MKMNKRITTVLLAILILINSGVIPAFANENYNEINSTDVGYCEKEVVNNNIDNSICNIQSEKNEEKVKTTINILDKYVKVKQHEDGINIFFVEAPMDVINGLDENIVNALLTNIEQINEEALSEDVTITKNGTIYDDSEEYLLQGGNVSKQKLYWWGGKVYLNRKDAENWIIDLESYGEYAEAAALIGSAAAIVAPGVGFTVIGASVVTMVKVSNLKKKTKKLLNNNPKDGIIVTYTIPGILTVDKQ